MQRGLVIVCMILGSRLGLHLFRKQNILDRPGPDVPKRERVPTLQGVVMVVLIIVCMLLLVSHQVSFVPGMPFAGMLWGVLLMVGINVVDELWRNVNKKYRIPAWIRLILQATAAVLAFSLSGVGIEQFILPGGWVIPLNPLSQIIFTIGRFWLFCNAINRFDGVYWLATWMSTIGFGSIALLVQYVVLGSYTLISAERSELLHDVVTVSTICACLGLVYTFIEYKPRGLVRDAGTMSMGFILAYLSLLGGAKIGMVLVVLALPLFDSIRVILDRIKRGKSPLKWDFTHLHYRLMALGRNRHEARATIWLWSIGIMIIMLLQDTNRMDKIIIFVLMAVFFFGINAYLFRKKWLPSEYDRKKHIGENEEAHMW